LAGTSDERSIFVTVSSVRGSIQTPIEHTEILLLQVTLCIYTIRRLINIVNVNIDKN